MYRRLEKEYSLDTVWYMQSFGYEREENIYCWQPNNKQIRKWS